MLRLAVLFVGVGLLCGTGYAQQLSISGAVHDAHGVVPGATVILQGPSGSKTEATTDDTGNYHFDALAAGPIATLRTHLSVPLAGVQDRSFVEHRQIAEAFEHGDVVSLESILTRHILGTRESYLAALQQGLIGAPP